MEIVYSANAHQLLAGRTYKNPRFFAGVEKDATKVFIIGDWPKIAAAYRGAKIPVEIVGAAENTTTIAPAAVVGPTAGLLPADEPSAIEIPEGWRELTYFSLRSLAQKFSKAVIADKESAVMAIEAEIARRAESAPKP